MLTAEEAKFATQSWYNPFQYRYTSKSNFLPDDLYDRLLESKHSFYSEPSKKIVNGETILDDRDEPDSDDEYYESNTLALGDFDHKSSLDYTLYAQRYPEWIQALDLIKAEMESYCNTEVHFRRWACIPNPPTVTFHYDFFSHLVQDNEHDELADIDLSKYFISFLILSPDIHSNPNQFRAGTTSQCPLPPDNIGLKADVQKNSWFMHSQNLGHQYIRSNHHYTDFFATCWMIK